MANELTPPTLGVAAPENATIGDENMEVREATVDVVNEERPAQVTGPPAKQVETVPVFEVVVVTDEVITDPASPLAVQIPDAGRGSFDLPIHQLAGPTPEQVFAAAAEKDEDEE